MSTQHVYVIMSYASLAKGGTKLYGVDQSLDGARKLVENNIKPEMNSDSTIVIYKTALGSCSDMIACLIAKPESLSWVKFLTLGLPHQWVWETYTPPNNYEKKNE